MREELRRVIIEHDFPIEGLNEIASREATGQGTKHIYRLHRWWARRPGNVFRAIIISSLLENLPKGKFGNLVLEDEPPETTDWKKDFWGTPERPGIFYQSLRDLFKDKVILDPFMGGGTTIIEGLRLGAKVVGIDINPLAWLITKIEAEMTDLDMQEIEREFKQLEREVGPGIKKYYKTYCPRCLAENRKPEEALVDAMYVFWVKYTDCTRCKERIYLFSQYLIAKAYRAEEKKNIYVCPSCFEIFGGLPNKDGKVTCPLNHNFDPLNGSVSGDKYTCPHCKAETEKVINVTRRKGILPAKMFGVEYFCHSHGRGFKKADEFDDHLYKNASELWEEVRDKYYGILVPDQEIPVLDETLRLHNHGYKRWSDMFNARQLLCLAKLLDGILKNVKPPLQEVFITVFSDMLQANCMLARYDTVDHGVQGLLAMHAFWCSVYSPVENNVWGITDQLGTRNFIMAYKKITEAYDSLAQAEEKYPSIYAHAKAKTVSVKDKPKKYVLAESFKQLQNCKANVMLLADTSENLTFLAPESIDAVITDPPYYANVHYSQLSDFFYVWLHKVLKDKYPKQFGPPLTLKAREIVVSKSDSKGHDFYIAAMVNVLQNAKRVLKDEGLLVSTYHHTQPESWVAIFTALLESGYYVIATYPVHSENVGSKHSIMGEERTEMRMFDTIIVARERIKQPKRKSWPDLRRELYLAAEEAVKRIEALHPTISLGDRRTVIMGKLIEVYSKHYPEVYRNGQKVSVREVVDEAFSLADEFIAGHKIPEVDLLSQFYVTTLIESGMVNYDELLKLTQPAGITIDELKRKGLIEGRGREFFVRSPIARGRDIQERKIDASLAIDVVHYLYFCYDQDKEVQWERLEDFESEKIESLLRYLRSRTGDVTYDKVREHFFKRGKRPKRGLEEYF